MEHDNNKARKTARSTKPIALRITDPELERQVLELSERQNLSLNMTVNMLLGYAFNQVKRTKKEFSPQIIFEIKG